MVLADPIPSNEMIAAHNPDGTVTFQPKKARRTIDIWLSAWRVFEQLIIIKKARNLLWTIKVSSVHSRVWAKIPMGRCFNTRFGV